MKLYITRHGTTEWNIEGRLQGWRDSALTEEGINRAIQLGKKLSNIDFDIVYSSPQKRALHTTQLILGNKNNKITLHNGIRELGFGTWEGMKLEDIEKEYPNEYYLYRNNSDLYVPIDGETIQDLIERVQDFFEEVKSKNVDNILVVTHGVVIKVMVTLIKGLAMKEFSDMPVYTGTSLNICEVREGNIELIVEDDTSHIDWKLWDELYINA